MAGSRYRALREIATVLASAHPVKPAATPIVHAGRCREARPPMSAATESEPARSTPTSHRTAYLLLTAIVVFWGINWPVMKVGLEAITPMWYALSRLLIGGLTLFAILRATGRLIVPGRHDWPIVVSVGLLQMAAFLTCVNFGLLYVDAGRAAILAYTTPLWVTPVAVGFLGERLGPRKAAGLVVGLAGVATLFNPLGFDWSDPAVITGNGLLMLAAFCWAGAILHTRNHPWRATPLQLAPWQMSVAAPLILVLALVFEGDAAVAWSAGLVVNIAYNGVVATAFCFWAAVTVQRSLPSVSTSLGLLGVPTAGMLFSALALGETLTPTRVGGLVLILAGMALVNLADLSARRGSE
jgi:drug/metabolite transporter (DMT)-like permease